jgi:hypothetical protein
VVVGVSERGSEAVDSFKVNFEGRLHQGVDWFICLIKVLVDVFDVSRLMNCNLKTRLVKNLEHL